MLESLISDDKLSIYMNLHLHQFTFRTLGSLGHSHFSYFQNKTVITLLEMWPEEEVVVDHD